MNAVKEHDRSALGALNLPDELLRLALRCKEAMETGKCLKFVSDAKPRLVEVHAVGLSTKDGGLVMRGYQVAGAASRPLPQWSLFRLDRMFDDQLSATVSDAPRDGYRMGDSQMSQVLYELEI